MLLNIDLDLDGQRVVQLRAADQNSIMFEYQRLVIEQTVRTILAGHNPGEHPWDPSFPKLGLSDVDAGLDRLENKLMGQQLNDRDHQILNRLELDRRLLEALNKRWDPDQIFLVNIPHVRINARINGPRGRKIEIGQTFAKREFQFRVPSWSPADRGQLEAWARIARASPRGVIFEVRKNALHLRSDVPEQVLGMLTEAILPQLSSQLPLREGTNGY